MKASEQLESGVSFNAKASRHVFQMWLVDLETGQRLGKDGQPVSDNSETFIASANSETVLMTLRSELLDRFAYASVAIRDLRTGKERRFTSPHLDQYTRERIQYLEWCRRGMLRKLFGAKPELTYYRPDRLVHK